MTARRQGDRLEEAFCKLILNSLSGKWGQRSRRWVLRPNRVPLQRWGTWYEVSQPDNPIEGEVPITRCYRGVAGKTQELVTDGIPRHCFPAISAFICSHGRERLRFLRNACPPRSVYYQAVDSLLL